MGAIWGIHNAKREIDFVDAGFVAIGWNALGRDLREIGDDRDDVKAALAEAYPDAKPRAIPVWAGILLRFAFEMRLDDLIVHPSKADSTLSFGRIASGYRFEPSAPSHRHRRDVEWLETDVPRAALSESARYELGSAITLFRVRRHAGEVEALLQGHEPLRAGSK